MSHTKTRIDDWDEPVANIGVAETSSQAKKVGRYTRAEFAEAFADALRDILCDERPPDA